MEKKREEENVKISFAISIERCAEVTQKVLAAVVKYCHDFNILWEGSLLKPNMVLPGADSKTTASPQDVAKHTVSVLARTIPPALPGVMVERERERERREGEPRERRSKEKNRKRDRIEIELLSIVHLYPSSIFTLLLIMSLSSSSLAVRAKKRPL
jgi:hypothetical protein